MDTSAKYFIADLVEEVGSLSTVAAQIVALTTDPECDMNQLTKVIHADNVMSARFLALANSAALSRGVEIRNLKDCLVRLGLDRVRNVALLMSMHDLAPETAALSCPPGGAASAMSRWTRGSTGRWIGQSSWTRSTGCRRGRKGERSPSN